MPATLQVWVDPLERRYRRGPLSLLVPEPRERGGGKRGGGGGRGKHRHDEGESWGWDMQTTRESGIGAFVDHGTKTAMLQPLCFTDAWLTNDSGLYRKLRLTDTSAATSPAWTQAPFRETEDHQFYGVDSSGVYGAVDTLRADWPKNQPWVFDFNIPGAQGDDFLLTEVLMGDLLVAFGTDGGVYAGREITPNVILDRGSLVEKKKNRSLYAPKEPGEGAVGTSLQGAWIRCLLLPCRQRDILVLTNKGGACALNLPDVSVPPADPDPTITAAGVFSVQWLQGAPQFSIAPGTFKTVGILYSPLLELDSAPETGEEATVTVYYDLPGYECGASVTGVLVDDTLAAFVPDGTKRACRIKVTLASDGTGTPTVYGASASFPGIAANTADAAVNLVAIGTLPTSVYAARLSVPEGPQGTQIQVDMQDLPAVEAAVPLARVTSNRPVQVQFGDVVWFRGRINEPDTEEGSVAVSKHLYFVASDFWQPFKTTYLKRPLPWDGRPLVDVIRELALMPGHLTEDDLDLEPTGLVLGQSTGPSEGEWAAIAESGDTVEHWLTELTEKFAGTYLLCCAPKPVADGGGVRFRWRDPRTLDLTPAVTLYPSLALAQAATGFTPKDAAYFVYTGFRQKVLPPEANDVAVVSYDPRLQTAHRAHLEDPASKIVTTAPGARPDNWWGEEKPYGFMSPEITNEYLANYAAAIAFDRLSPARPVCEVKAQMALWPDGRPVWQGEVIELAPDPAYNVAGGRYMVRNFSADLKFETAGLTDRPATYAGEYKAPYGG